MRYGQSTKFFSILLVVAELQHFVVGISRGKNLPLAAICTIPVHLLSSAKYAGGGPNNQGDWKNFRNLLSVGAEF